MRRPPSSFLHLLKDQIRTVRYTVRAEAGTLSAGLPKAVGAIDLTPFIAVGSVVGTPALRVVDGLLTHVESLADVIGRRSVTDPGYTIDIADCFDAEFSFSERLYGVYKRILADNNVDNALLSEQAFDVAAKQFRSRFGDLTRDPRGGWATRASAGLACALAEARPIRKVAFAGTDFGSSPLMLAPNLYCGAVVGLMAALAADNPSVRDEPDMLHEAVEAVVKARLDRMKRAVSGRSPETDLAAQFEALLPFLP